MRKFFFLSTTFFVREGEAGGAAGGATAPANGAGAASAALASKMDGGGGQQTPPAGDGGDAPWYSTLPTEQHALIQTKGRRRRELHESREAARGRSRWPHRHHTYRQVDARRDRRLPHEARRSRQG